MENRYGYRGYRGQRRRFFEEDQFDRDVDRGYGSAFDARSDFYADFGNENSPYKRGYDFEKEQRYEYGEPPYYGRYPSSFQAGRGPFDTDQSFGMNRQRFRERPSYRSLPGREWDVPGPYVGVGPAGYTRSDERVYDEVCSMLTQHGQIDASGIEVEVHQGEVTLKGTVDKRSDRWMAEDMIESIPGVEFVNDRLRVSPSGGARVRGMGRENVVMPGRIIPGMSVFGLDGELVGTVKEVGNRDFFIDRPMGHDLRVPFDAVRRTNGDIYLSLPSFEVDQQGWQTGSRVRSR